MSELYASMLMIGVTLAVGAAVVFAATNQFSLATGAEAVGSSLQLSSSGAQVALVFASVSPSGSCPLYLGENEGTTLVLALYNYGTTRFAPAEVVVNSTVYAGGYSVVFPGEMVTYALALGSCSHASGLAILMADPGGDVAQFGS